MFDPAAPPVGSFAVRLHWLLQHPCSLLVWALFSRWPAVLLHSCTFMRILDAIACPFVCRAKNAHGLLSLLSPAIDRAIMVIAAACVRWCLYAVHGHTYVCCAVHNMLRTLVGSRPAISLIPMHSRLRAASHSCSSLVRCRNKNSGASSFFEQKCVHAWPLLLSLCSSFIPDTWFRARLGHVPSNALAGRRRDARAYGLNYFQSHSVFAYFALRSKPTPKTIFKNNSEKTQNALLESEALNTCSYTKTSRKFQSIDGIAG